MQSVSFVSYDGRWPNLCAGQLTVKIGNKKYTLPSHLFASGGSVSFDKDWNENVTEGEWFVSDCYLKDCEPIVKEHIDAIIRVMNENVKHGCCGGCV